ncbi:DUF3298 and DUF4163 domain-containing protein [Cognatilysobacter tabacisoli]|uniref:DUF3298 and DUF4163 domain-containing protein n=1 Tax=Cognatilysobacter tabacisoli TaxID=2315424 RepID=UPI000E6AF00E|nr:DUF3298 and DUF4163 domain-containing protein [Lysobacter tabacisoli]
MTRAQLIGSTLLIGALLSSGCRREGDAPPATAPAAPTPAPATVELKDVVETTPDYVIGISYPPSMAKYPKLANELRAFADRSRATLVEAAKERGTAPGASPYDLSLSFTEVLDSPTLVAVAADGSSYTGGAHGAPILERFVWLPAQDRRLTAQDLVPDPAGWQAIARFVREQLHVALSQRVDADDLDPAERADVVKNAGAMIDAGTEPAPANFSQFEPVVAPDGKLVALRFVFAPYQVGPYSDGVQTVEVPAAVLLPHVAPAYRAMFQEGPAPPAG